MNKLRGAAATGLALATLFLAPACAVAQTDKSSDTYRALNLFGDVFERVRSEYVEEVSDQELIEAAINGMLTSLDPHSSYMTRDEWEDMQVQTKGEFGGLGIEVTMEEGLVKVVAPIDDTPAARAGLQANDLISHIDNEPVMGLTLQEAVDKMRGAVGSKINITVRRGEQEPFDVSLTRAVIKVQSVKWRVEEDVGYIRITTFNDQTQIGLERAIADIKAQAGEKLVGYVLDLRNNPGGLLDKAISVSDSFLEKGEIVSTRSETHPEAGQRYNAKPGDLIDGKPLIVLINGGSASASEIVAGALQDHQRAVVLGTQSFGKGSVQTIMPLPGAGAMRLTTARYFTPSGRSIQAMGVAPDIIIEQAKLEVVETNGARSERDLRDALANPDATTPAEVPAEGEGEAAPGPESSLPGVGAPGEPSADAGQEPATEGEAAAAGTAEEVDYQLDRAIDLLRGVFLFTQRAASN